jgi:hypothetical protein
MAVAKFVEVAECDAGGAVVVKDNVGDAGELDVGGDADGRKWDFFAEVGVDEEKAVDGAVDEELGILLNEIGAAEVTDGEVEVAGLEEELLDAEHEAGKVAFAKFGHDDANGVGEAGAEHPGVDVGAVLEFFGSVDDALAGVR